MSRPAPETTDLYATLALPSPVTGHVVTQSQIKAAFRRALLLHHPDKASQVLGQSTGTRTSRQTPDAAAKYSIDNICVARDILTDPTSRREYDRLYLQRASLAAPSTNGSIQVGNHPTELDTVDLDDMMFDEATQTWARECRCGNIRAYEVAEEDLEEAVANGSGEVLVGCGGCSLHVRILFDAVECEADQDEVARSAAGE